MDDELAQIRQKRLEELQQSAAAPSVATPEPTEVTTATFESFVGGHKIAMIDVWAVWCGPCRTMEPIVEELAAEWAGRAAVGKLDADANYDTLMKFGIQGIPTFLFFKDGKLAGRLVGARPKRDFHEALRQLEIVSVDRDPAVQ